MRGQCAGEGFSGGARDGCDDKVAWVGEVLGEVLVVWRGECGGLGTYAAAVEVYGRGVLLLVGGEGAGDGGYDGVGRDVA